MDFQDCKVRISNVDSQASHETIVIQVIGEIANKGGEPKKFVQTFVLAQQPTGYFVLNDMLRYIDEDLEAETEAASAQSSAAVQMPAVEEPEAKADTAAPEEAAQEPKPAALDTAAVTEKLEETAVEPQAAAETPAAEPAAETQEALPIEAAQAQPDVEKTVEAIAAEELKQPEEPKDPAPTPAVAPAPVRAPAPAPAPAQPEKPKEPPKPMSWASRVAAAAGAPRPVVPVAPIPKTATPPAPAQPRASAPPAQQQTAPAAQQPEGTQTPAAPKDQGSEWQTAETKRQSRVPPAAAAPAEKEGTMAYIKYVTDKVKEEDLKAALTNFGELAYFDINRQKVNAITPPQSTNPRMPPGAISSNSVSELRLRRVQDPGGLQRRGGREPAPGKRRNHRGGAAPAQGQRVWRCQLQRHAGRRRSRRARRLRSFPRRQPGRRTWRLHGPVAWPRRWRRSPWSGCFPGRCGLVGHHGVRDPSGNRLAARPPAPLPRAWKWGKGSRDISRIG